MNGSGICYEDVIAANVRNQKDKEIENLKQEVERLKNINEEHRILNGKLRVENNRLNNIINELENYIKVELKNVIPMWNLETHYSFGESTIYEYILNKLQELKGVDEE